MKALKTTISGSSFLRSCNLETVSLLREDLPSMEHWRLTYPSTRPFSPSYSTVALDSPLGFVGSDDCPSGAGRTLLFVGDGSIHMTVQVSLPRRYSPR